jgi:hypothetical protein
MAYMSDAKDRYNAICGATSLSLPLAAEQAVREAERILAVTEPRANVANRISVTRLVGAGRPDGLGPTIGSDCTYALADSLAAILPVLDELAEDAARAMDAR